MSIFDGIEKAEAYGQKRKYMQVEGEFVAKINSIEEITTRKKEKGVGVEFEIIDSSCPEKVRVGSTYSQWIQITGREQKHVLGTLKALFSAVAGVPAEEITVAECEEYISEDQPLAGTEVALETTQTPMQDEDGKDIPGKNWTNLNWSTIETSEEE